MRILRGQYRATSEDRARIWTKLHAAASSAAASELAPRASAAASELAPRASRWLWMVVPACAVLALTAAGLHYGQGADGQGGSAPASPASSANVAANSGPAAIESTVEPAAPGTPVGSLPSIVKVENAAPGSSTLSARRSGSGVTPSGRPAAPSARVTEPSGTPLVDTLEEETRLLGAAMRTSDKARALALLEEHAARFPRGELAGERDVQRIFALCALGRTDDAKRRAQGFLSGRAPDALTRRVDQSCAAR